MTGVSKTSKGKAGASRGGLHRVVVDRLAMRIISGEVAAGDLLPVEADLCTALGVGRSSIREAMRVLADKGMVEVRPRTGARVLPRPSWKRLDADVVRWIVASGADREFLADLVEARRIFEPAAAALAAERATGADLAKIEKALEAMIAAMPEDGKNTRLDACVDADVSFHKAILQSTHNAVLEEFEIIIDAALRAAFKLSTELARSYAQTISAHGDVYEAIRLRDGKRAQRAMSDLLDVAASDLGLS